MLKKSCRYLDKVKSWNDEDKDEITILLEDNYWFQDGTKRKTGRKEKMHRELKAASPYTAPLG